MAVAEAVEDLAVVVVPPEVEEVETPTYLLKIKTEIKETLSVLKVPESNFDFYVI